MFSSVTLKRCKDGSLDMRIPSNQGLDKYGDHSDKECEAVFDETFFIYTSLDVAYKRLQKRINKKIEKEGLINNEALA